jgi:hypothetical protein
MTKKDALILLNALEQALPRLLTLVMAMPDDAVITPAMIFPLTGDEVEAQVRAQKGKPT